ncbi:hypothetical protein ACJX0J_031086, partial [Zea mays]
FPYLQDKRCIIWCFVAGGLINFLNLAISIFKIVRIFFRIERDKIGKENKN